jgi:hypothetical protein
MKNISDKQYYILSDKLISVAENDENEQIVEKI